MGTVMISVRRRLSLSESSSIFFLLSDGRSDRYAEKRRRRRKSGQRPTPSSSPWSTSLSKVCSDFACAWHLHTYLRFSSIYPYRLLPIFLHISHNISRYMVGVQIQKQANIAIYARRPTKACPLLPPGYPLPEAKSPNSRDGGKKRGGGRGSSTPNAKRGKSA